VTVSVEMRARILFARVIVASSATRASRRTRAVGSSSTSSRARCRAEGRARASTRADGDGDGWDRYGGDDEGDDDARGRARGDREVMDEDAREWLARVDGRASTSTTTTLEPGLFLVATPIGNLGDVTLRALRTLRDADAVLAEDTRRTKQLLRAYGISTPLVSYHAHNEAKRREEALGRLAGGAALALVSDAGMPTVNDPGQDLAARAAEIGVRVVPVPGPSAVLAAIAGAGLPTDEFTFIGFPPPKSAARVKRFKSFARAKATLIMFVPPHKLIGTLEAAVTALGDRRCAVCRELTKVHEEFWRGTLSESKREFEERTPRGEITLVIEGFDGDDRALSVESDEEDGIPNSSSVEDAVRALLRDGVSPSEASRRVAKDLGVRRRETYGVAQRLSEELKK